MQLTNRRFEVERFSQRAKSLTMVSIFLGLTLLVAACGDNTATTTSATVAVTAAATTAPAATTSTATTAAAITSASPTTASATSASATTAAATTTAITSAAATTASATTAPTTTVASSGSTSAGTGQAKVTLANTTVPAGTTIDVNGEGFPTNSWVTIQFGPGTTTRQVASLALTDSAGKFKVPLILSSYGDGSKIQPGSNIVKAITQDGQVMASLTFNITPAAATATPNS